MKRIVLLLTLLFGVQALYAQGFLERYPQTEVSFTYSFYPRQAADEFLDAHFTAIAGQSSPYASGYQGNQIHCLGLLTGEVAFKLRKWFTVGVQLAGTSFWADTVNGDGRISGTAFYLLPNVRFTYVRSEVFNMYSGIGLGVGVLSGFSGEKSAFAGIGGADIQTAVQAVPVGIQFGRDIYGIAEVSLGTMNVGLRAGIGYRF
jgi:hypothetical protein